MKRVFSSHSQVCHIWANQTQAEGEANNIFFHGRRIFSYGHHYLAAQIHVVSGKNFALVRSDSYGPATSKHLCRISDSLRGLMPYFCVENVATPRAARRELDARVDREIDRALKRSKITDRSSINFEFECIKQRLDEANQLRKLLGLKAIQVAKADRDAVKKHLEKRLARYNELNTPEMLAAKEAERIKIAELKHAERLKALDLQVSAFRNGDNVGYINLDFELIRIKDDVVQTSRGAEVPLDQARRLLNLIQSENPSRILGHEIGGFKVSSIDDGIIAIGCHRIQISEAQSVLGSHGHLRLVQQAEN